MSHQPKPINSKTKKQEDSFNLGSQSLTIKDTIPASQGPIIVNFKIERPSKVETYFEKMINEDSFTQTQLYTFGSNEMGQLGTDLDVLTGKFIDGGNFSSTPINLSSLNEKRITSISAGDGHSICVTSSGTIYAWGASACGQLGIDQNDQMQTDAEGYPYQPKPIQIKLLKDYKVKEVACGDAHTLALGYDGQIFSWGGAGCGQLGHSNISLMPRDADSCPYQPFPKLVESLKNIFIIHIACGKAHSLAIDNTYSLFTWGAGACGQLGVDDIHTLPVDDDGYPFQPVPKILKSLKGKEVITGACGDVHTVILTRKGEVYSFGGGSFGQLGLGSISKMPLDSDSYPFMPTPSKIEALSFINVIKISCGDSHTMALDSEGKLYAWGAAACGQLGLENLATLPKDGEGNPYEPEPKIVSFFENLKVESVACGESHTLVLVEGGTLYSFGNSSCGQLGYMDKKEKNAKSLPRSIQSRINESSQSGSLGRPRLVTSFFGKIVSKLACGGVHNLCLTQSESSHAYELFRLFKLEMFTDIQLEIENLDQTFIIKAHKFILLNKSKYFYDLVISDTKVVNFKNVDELVFRNIIDYFYIEDLNFTEEFKTIDQLLDALKLTKLFNLKTLEEKIEFRLKSLLSKYSEALQLIDKTEGVTLNKMTSQIVTTPVNETSEAECSAISTNTQTTSSNSSFKGLFFLPNGNPIIIFDESLVEKITKNSYIINLGAASEIQGSSKEAGSNYRLYSQKNSQGNSFNLDSKEMVVKVKNKSNSMNQISNNSQFNFGKQAVGGSSELSGTNDTLISLNESIVGPNLSKSKNLPFFQEFSKATSGNYKDILKSHGLIDNELPDSLKYFNSKDTCDIILKVDDFEFYCQKVTYYIIQNR